MTFRAAGPADADRVAGLHAASWRRHYRGAYTDAFLDGDVEADRRAMWTTRFPESTPDTSATVPAEDGGRLAGLVHVIFGRAADATEVERAFVSPPGGEPGRLDGTPMKLRMAWADATVLT